MTRDIISQKGSCFGEAYGYLQATLSAFQAGGTMYLSTWTRDGEGRNVVACEIILQTWSR